MSNALEATVLIGADIDPFEKGMKDAEKVAEKSSREIARDLVVIIGGAFKAIGAIASTIGTAIKATFNGLLAIGQQIFDSVELAGRRADILDFFSTVFRGLDSQAREFTDTFADAYNVSLVQAEDQLSRFQDLFKGGIGFSPEDAFEITRIASQLSADLAQTSGRSFAETAAAIRSIISGSFEVATSNFGVKISEELVRLEAIRLGLVDETTKRLNQQQKAQAALSLLAQGTTDAAGAAARNARGFTGQLERARAIFEQIRLIVGEALLESFESGLLAINQGLENARDTIRTWAQAAKPFIDTVTNVLLAFFENPQRILDFFSVLATAISQILVDAIGDAIKAIGERFPRIAALVGQERTTSGSGASNFGLAGFINAVTAGQGGALAARFAARQTPPEELRGSALLLNAINNLAGFGAEFNTGLKQQQEPLLNALDTLNGLIGGQQTGFVNRIASGLQGAFAQLPGLDDIGSFIQSLPPASVTAVNESQSRISTARELSDSIQDAIFNQESPEVKEQKKTNGKLDEIKGVLEGIGKGANLISTTFVNAF